MVKATYLIGKNSFLHFSAPLHWLLSPYFLACLLIAVFQLSQKIKAGAQKVPLTNSSTPLDQHNFKDENGKIMLAIKPQQLLFLKSENNYTAIYYLQNEKVEKKLIRTNLKKLESELEAFPNLQRIHRSYMVNLKNIASVQRIKRSFQIKMTHLPDMPLKVSETYKAVFTTQIEKN